MKTSRHKTIVAAICVAASACTAGTRQSVTTSASVPVATAPALSPEAEAAAIAQARTDSIRRPYTAADVAFMSRMIQHHAQAIAMSRLASTHGASPAVQRLADRIINAQQDEIVTMQTWLRDRQKPVPEATPAWATTGGDGTQHQMMMPGMITEAQMKQLDASRRAEFDRLFLLYMIQHHKGAVSMVKELFDTYGAGQDEIVFKFASDVSVDQTTEIARMEKMLISATLGVDTQ